MELKTHFLAIADALVEQTGLSEATISTRVANDGKMLKRIRSGGSFTDRTYDALVQFAKHRGVVIPTNQTVTENASAVERT